MYQGFRFEQAAACKRMRTYTAATSAFEWEPSNRKHAYGITRWQIVASLLAVPHLDTTPLIAALSNPWSVRVGWSGLVRSSSSQGFWGVGLHCHRYLHPPRSLNFAVSRLLQRPDLCVMLQSRGQMPACRHWRAISSS